MGDSENFNSYNNLLLCLTSHEQKTVLLTLLRLVSSRILGCSEKNKSIGGLAALISGLIADNSCLQQCLVHWLGGIPAGGIGSETESRRAVIAAISPRRGGRFFLSPMHRLSYKQNYSKRHLTKLWISLVIGYTSNMRQYFSRKVRFQYSE